MARPKNLGPAGPNVTDYDWGFTVKLPPKPKPVQVTKPRMYFDADGNQVSKDQYLKLRGNRTDKQFIEDSYRAFKAGQRESSGGVQRAMRRTASRTTGPRGGIRTTTRRGEVGPRGGRYSVTRRRGGSSRSRGRKRVYLGAS